MESLAQAKPESPTKLLNTEGSRYNVDETTIKASEKEWRTYRLTSFNENIQRLISRAMSFKSFEEIDQLKNLEKSATYMAPHLAIGHGVIRPTVLVCGDPFRCQVVANLCEEATEIKWNREYRTFNITYEGAEMTVVSHGIGGPGAAICFEELIKLGATTIIRLGTCGSLKPKEIKQGQLIVSTSACREDGHSAWMVPSGFPAVADPRVALALFDEAKRQGHTVHMGVTLTSGNFYPGPAVASTLQVNADAGALSVEMENATLFCVGTVRGIRTGAVACIDGSPFHWDDGDYDPHGTVVAEGKKNMILTGLKVAKKIVEENQSSPDMVLKKTASTNKKEANIIFPEEETQNYLKIFKEQTMMEFLASLASLTDQNKEKIISLTQGGNVSDLQFFLENGTEISEADIKILIILYHKVQKGLDQAFSETVKQMKSSESASPTTPTN